MKNANARNRFWILGVILLSGCQTIVPSYTIDNVINDTKIELQPISTNNVFNVIEAVINSLTSSDITDWKHYDVIVDNVLIQSQDFYISKQYPYRANSREICIVKNFFDRFKYYGITRRISPNFAIKRGLSKTVNTIKENRQNGK